MVTHRSCSWCGRLNQISHNVPVFCSSCHHRADATAEQCDCPRCWTLPDVPGPVVELPDVPAMVEVPAFAPAVELWQDEPPITVTCGGDRTWFIKPTITPDEVTLMMNPVGNPNEWVQVQFRIDVLRAIIQDAESQVNTTK